MKHGLKKATSFACCRVQGKPCCKLQDFEKRIRAQLKQHPSQPTQCYENQSDNLVKHAPTFPTQQPQHLSSRAKPSALLVLSENGPRAVEKISFHQRVSRRFFHHDR